jgi:hypothetical protein
LIIQPRLKPLAPMVTTIPKAAVAMTFCSGTWVRRHDRRQFGLHGLTTDAQRPDGDVIFGGAGTRGSLCTGQGDNPFRMWSRNTRSMRM